MFADTDAFPAVVCCAFLRCRYTNLVWVCIEAGDYVGARELWTAAFRSTTVSSTNNNEALVPDGAAFTAGITAIAMDDQEWRTAVALLREGEQIVDDAYHQPPPAVDDDDDGDERRKTESRNAKYRRLKPLHPSVTAYRSVSSFVGGVCMCVW